MIAQRRSGINTRDATLFSLSTLCAFILVGCAATAPRLRSALPQTSLVNGFYLYPSPRTFDGIGTILRIDKNGTATGELDLSKILDPDNDIERAGREFWPEIALYSASARDFNLTKLLGISAEWNASASLVVKATNIQTYRLTDVGLRHIRDTAEATTRRLLRDEPQQGTTYALVRAVNLTKDLHLSVRSAAANQFNKARQPDTNTVALHNLLDLVSPLSIKQSDSSSESIEYDCAFDTLYNVAYLPLLPRAAHTSIGLSHPFELGFAVGHETAGRLFLGNVPHEIRTTPPHPDDVANRPNQILSPEVPDNYLIRDQSVRLAADHGPSIEAVLSWKGIVTVALRTSAISNSPLVDSTNLFRRDYISQGFEGPALIFYDVEVKRRSLLSGGSFSLPLSVSYPLCAFGTQRQSWLRVGGSTNALWPDKIRLQAAQGWDRFGERQIAKLTDLGALKISEWNVTLAVEHALSTSFALAAQVALVFTDYTEDFRYPLDFNSRDNTRLSFGVGARQALGL
jgi:hypothetical protein